MKWPNWCPRSLRKRDRAVGHSVACEDRDAFVGLSAIRIQSQGACQGPVEDDELWIGDRLRKDAGVKPLGKSRIAVFKVPADFSADFLQGFAFS